MAANSTEETTIEDNEAEETLPLVFQCTGCLSILGDSFAWVCADPNLRTVSLSAVTHGVHIATEDGMEISTEGDDLGSTFIPLQCTACQAKIGRIYKTTPRKLDMIRDIYTLDCSSIKSYQLGSQKAKNTFKSTEEILEIPTAQVLHSEIIKVQSVIVTLNERLQALESQLVTNETQVREQEKKRSTPERNIKRNLRNNSDSNLNLEALENGPTKQKRKRVFNRMSRE
ncbi:protein Mis18-alpha-like [Actinia tenebrosa]|uniref:Protein Mis18-alpha-like n=1 Tax=Actinia tenebrosa TaxID=6105 RepID=A0A6P8ILE0_ACTTE|nr:protein Mis18-alpha-like [Actinia tenebrosa]